MMPEPALTPVTAPEAEPTDSEDEPELQMPPDTASVKVVTDPTQTFMVPPIGDEPGVTFTVSPIEAIAGQPVPLTVYIIVTLPDAIPVTTPVMGSTEAIAEL